MTGVYLHINWWSFVPIFLKIDSDITKIKKVPFLEGVVDGQPDG